MHYLLQQTLCELRSVFQMHAHWAAVIAKATGAAAVSGKEHS
jgi:hypothetical protein